MASNNNKWEVFTGWKIKENEKEIITNYIQKHTLHVTLKYNLNQEPNGGKMAKKSKGFIYANKFNECNLEFLTNRKISAQAKRNSSRR